MATMKSGRSSTASSPFLLPSGSSSVYGAAEQNSYQNGQGGFIQMGVRPGPGGDVYISPALGPRKAPDTRFGAVANYADGFLAKDPGLRKFQYLLVLLVIGTLIGVIVYLGVKDSAKKAKAFVPYCPIEALRCTYGYVAVLHSNGHPYCESTAIAGSVQSTLVDGASSLCPALAFPKAQGVYDCAHPSTVSPLPQPEYSCVTLATAQSALNGTKAFLMMAVGGTGYSTYGSLSYSCFLCPSDM